MGIAGWDAVVGCSNQLNGPGRFGLYPLSTTTKQTTSSRLPVSVSYDAISWGNKIGLRERQPAVKEERLPAGAKRGEAVGRGEERRGSRRRLVWAHYNTEEATGVDAVGGRWGLARCT